MPASSLPPPSKRRKTTGVTSLFKTLEHEITTAVANNASLNSLTDLLKLTQQTSETRELSKAIYSLYRVFVVIVSNDKLAPGGGDAAKAVRKWIWERLDTYVELLVGLLQDEEPSLRKSALDILFSLLRHLSTSLTKFSLESQPQFHFSHFKRIVHGLLICPPSFRSHHGEPQEGKTSPDVRDHFVEIWFTVYDDIRWCFLRDASYLLSKFSEAEHPNLLTNLLSIMEKLTTFPTEPSELNAWWVQELGKKPLQPKNARTDGDDEPDDVMSNAGDENEEDDWPTLLSIPTGSEDDYPWREFVMRTFHPFSSPHIQMPDAVQLDAQLNPATSKSQSPAPTPPNPTLDILVNTTSSSSPVRNAHTSTEQISSAHHQHTNGVAPSQLPVTSAPPSILSNPDPNASLQSILAASRKGAISPQAALHHPWVIPSIPTPSPAPHPNPTHATLVPQPSHSKNGKRKLDDPEQDDPHPKIRRTVRDHVSQDPTRLLPMTTVVCLHAAVAQKSYGSEKRFLCPPPVVHIQGPVWQMRSQQLSMAVVSEQGERSFDQKTTLDNNMSGSFKFLHVTGTAKAKSFQLSLDIADPPSSVSGEGNDASAGRVWASFDSAPVTIISKPSKKTAKTRNISSCILAGGPVSLFNRINSQTVRTKYMTIDSAQFCASNVTWSAFNVNVVRRPDESSPPHGGPQPVTYGCEVVLSDTLSNIATSPLVIRKVDKGRVSLEDGGPVSQMQKIALQKVNPDGTRHYLSAAGPIPGAPGVVSPSTPGVPSQGGTHPLIFQPPRIRDEMKDGVRILSDEVDDYLCWTIVGISKFQYTFFDAFGQNNSIPELPITPFPTLFTPPIYRPANNTLELTVSHFFYEDLKTRTQQPLTVYLGNIGPLRSRFYPAPQSGPLTTISPFGGGMPGPSTELTAGGDSTTVGGASVAPTGISPARYIPQQPMHTLVTVDMPSLAEVIKALQEDAMPLNVLPADGAHGSHGVRNGNDAASSAQIDGSITDGSQAPTSHPPPSITGRSLPLLFIRASDGVGYHSGRTITCENVFQSMELGAIASGHVLTPPGGATADSNWLAAAQAAATADGGLHGWTLRVM